jgi:hypothetical protein
LSLRVLRRHQHAVRRGYRSRQPAPHGALALLLRPHHARPERVAPAGVQHDDLDLARAVGRQQRLVEGHRLEVGIASVGERGVDWDQIVPAVDFDAVARVVDEGEVGGVGLAREAGQRRLHGDEVGIEHNFDIVELDALERGRDLARIVAGIIERLLVSVLGIADHERHAPLGVRDCRRTQQHKSQSNSR